MNDRIENLSIDCAILGFEEGRLQVLLIKRNKEPGYNRWSLPGAYVYINEHIDASAKRILQDLTGVEDIFLSQLSVFGGVDRYPTHRVVSVLYCALDKPERFQLTAGSHAKAAEWFPLDELPKLPFDHQQMIDCATNWLKEAVWKEPIMASLLPKKFPLNQMQELYSAILNEPIDNRNFRKKVIGQGLVHRLEEKTKGGKQRPAFLYTLKGQ